MDLIILLKDWKANKYFKDWYPSKEWGRILPPVKIFPGTTVSCWNKTGKID